MTDIATAAAGALIAAAHTAAMASAATAVAATPTAGLAATVVFGGAWTWLAVNIHHDRSHPRLAGRAVNVLTSWIED